MNRDQLLSPGFLMPIILVSAIGFMIFLSERASDKIGRVDDQLIIRINKENDVKYTLWKKISGRTDITREEFNILNVDDRLIRAIDINKINNSNLEVGH